MINCKYCFTSDVMYKKDKRLVYTFPDLFSKNLFSRPYLQL